MIKVRQFTVLGEPRGKGRPRTRQANGETWHYTPQSTREYENWIRDQYAIQCRGAEIIPKGTAIMMQIDCVYGVPESVSKKRGKMMLSNLIMPTKKPDADNVLKVVADALNGLAYHDDAQIVSATVRKMYGIEPMIKVWISEA